jgi:hypothetical protein
MSVERYGSLQLLRLRIFAEERRIDFRDPAATTDIEDLGKAVSLAEGDRQAIEITPVPEHE